MRNNKATANKQPMAHLIRIKIKVGKKSGHFFASSPDLEGLLVTEPTIPELEKHVERAIVALYEACGEAVVVSKIEERMDGDVSPWVAIPSSIAKHALELQEF